MGKVIYSLFIIAVICFFIFINNCNFSKNSHLGELIDYYTVLCCERESIIKYIITLSDTKKMKFQKLRRLNHKLSTEALTDKSDWSERLCFLGYQQKSLLLSGFKIFITFIYHFHLTENRVASFRFSTSHWQFSLSILTTLKSDSVTACKVLKECLAEKQISFKKQKC